MRILFSFVLLVCIGTGSTTSTLQILKILTNSQNTPNGLDKFERPETSKESGLTSAYKVLETNIKKRLQMSELETATNEDVNDISSDKFYILLKLLSVKLNFVKQITQAILQQRPPRESSSSDISFIRQNLETLEKLQHKSFSPTKQLSPLSMQVWGEGVHERATEASINCYLNHARCIRLLRSYLEESTHRETKHEKRDPDSAGGNSEEPQESKSRVPKHVLNVEDKLEEVHKSQKHRDDLKEKERTLSNTILKLLRTIDDMSEQGCMREQIVFEVFISGEVELNELMDLINSNIRTSWVPAITEPEEGFETLEKSINGTITKYFGGLGDDQSSNNNEQIQNPRDGNEKQGGEQLPEQPNSFSENNPVKHSMPYLEELHKYFKDKQLDSTHRTDLSDQRRLEPYKTGRSSSFVVYACNEKVGKSYSIGTDVLMKTEKEKETSLREVSEGKTLVQIQAEGVLYSDKNEPLRASDFANYVKQNPNIIVNDEGLNVVSSGINRNKRMPQMRGIFDTNQAFNLYDPDISLVLVLDLTTHLLNKKQNHEINRSNNQSSNPKLQNTTNTSGKSSNGEGFDILHNVRLKLLSLLTNTIDSNPGGSQVIDLHHDKHVPLETNLHFDKNRLKSVGSCFMDPKTRGIYTTNDFGSDFPTQQKKQFIQLLTNPNIYIHQFIIHGLGESSNITNQLSASAARLALQMKIKRELTLSELNPRIVGAKSVYDTAKGKETIKYPSWILALSIISPLLIILIAIIMVWQLRKRKGYLHDHIDCRDPPSSEAIARHTHESLIIRQKNFLVKPFYYFRRTFKQNM